MLYSPRPSESLDGQTSFPSGSWAVDGASGASQNRMLHFQLTFNSSYRDLKPSPGLSSTEDELLHEPSKGGETRLQLPHSRGPWQKLKTTLTRPQSQAERLCELDLEASPRLRWRGEELVPPALSVQASAKYSMQGEMQCVASMW